MVIEKGRRVTERAIFFIPRASSAVHRAVIELASPSDAVPIEFSLGPGGKRFAHSSPSHCKPFMRLALTQSIKTETETAIVRMHGCKESSLLPSAGTRKGRSKIATKFAYGTNASESPADAPGFLSSA